MSFVIASVLLQRIVYRDLKPENIMLDEHVSLSQVIILSATQPYHFCPFPTDIFFI
jgi:serine/threonine protein kinase